MTVLFCILLTLAAYLAARRLFLKYHHPALNVVGLAAAAIILVLLLLGIPESDYAPARKIMTSLLGAATVAMALPLYRFRHVLKRHLAPVLLGVGLGSLVSMLLAGAIVRVAGLPREFVVSILPKGSTMPFAISLAELYDGNAALASAFVVATGTLGCLLGGWLLNRLGVREPFVRGLTLGCAAHAQGAGQALSEGEECGAMAALAMILGGLFTVALAPLAVWLLGL